MSSTNQEGTVEDGAVDGVARRRRRRPTERRAGQRLGSVLGRRRRLVQTDQVVVDLSLGLVDVGRQLGHRRPARSRRGSAAAAAAVASVRRRGVRVNGGRFI